MLEKGAVLGRQEGAHQQRRIFLIAQLDAAFARIGMDDLSIAAAHHGRQRRFVFEQRVDIGQVPREQGPGGDQAEADAASARDEAEAAKEMAESFTGQDSVEKEFEELGSTSASAEVQDKLEALKAISI